MDKKVANNGGIFHHLLVGYSTFLFNYPGTILLVTSIMTTIIPVTVLFFNPLQINRNPETGFDTRETEYSGQRLTWEKLAGNIQASNRIVLPDTTAAAATAVVRKNRLKRSWADELLNTFGQVACYETAIPGMDFLTQFIVEVNSYEELFDFDYLKMLCSLHASLNDQFQSFANVTPYRNVWSLPNYLSCLSPNFLTNCTFLDENDIEFGRHIIDYCRSYRREIIGCRRDCYSNCPRCSEVPKNCSTQMIFDLFYRILPRNLNTKPVYINGFLPIFTLSGYRSQGFYGATIEQYLSLQNALRNFSKKQRKFKLKGLSMDIKRDLLYDAAKRDSFLAFGAAFSVFLIVFLYSMNIFYCIMVAIVLLASVTSALALYSLFTVNFPLLNLVTFVLLLAVGSDDAFVLMNSFPVDVTSRGIYQCLSHTASAMLLTSSSTAVPFFASIFSSVVVFRCFGLFAGITLVFNYLLEISLLPAMLVFQDRYIKRCISRRAFAKLNYLMHDLLPFVIISGRYIWISSLTVIVAAMTYLTYANLQFPPYNPLQLFVDSNVHEWYDNNAERNFEFVANKLQIPISVRLIWGLTRRASQSTFQPDKLTTIQHDPKFSLHNTTDIEALAWKLRGYRELNFIKHESQYWPERYLIWSRNFTCEPFKICCNFADANFHENLTDYCIRLSTTYLFTQYNDTLIYDNSTFKLVGYTAMLPTRLKFSHRFTNLSYSFNFLERAFSDMNYGGWYTTEWTLISVWFDLLNSIITDCRQSLLLSFSVVAIFAFLHLRLKSLTALVTICCIVVVTVGCVVTVGWVIGVLEAIILILVVGLSFDFTLHYGVSVPSIGCGKHRVWLAARKSTVPVTLSALSSFAAGCSMLIAETHAFHQVGVFLITLASVSWLYATFFFLPLLSFTLRSDVNCELCPNDSVAQIDLPLKEKSTFM